MTFLSSAALLFLAVSLLFYMLFAGADFGAGILELFLGKKQKAEQRALISHAMAPIWEANHVWLVLAIVILFMGFPPIYAQISLYLHLPLIALLMGIVFRGCAFTFRYYDTLGDRYHPAYSWVFSLSSLWSAYFVGTLCGAVLLGKIDPQATTYAALFLHPWLNPFCASLGIFTALLFAFLASVYLVGEAETRSLQDLFRRKARGMNAALIGVGALVFGTAEASGLPLLAYFVETPFSVGCFAIASVLWLPFWAALSKAQPGSTLVVRGLAVTIACLVLFGWFAMQYPIALRYAGGDSLNFAQSAAPPATLRALLGALVFGVLAIFPALGYLFSVFKWSTLKR